MTASTLVIIVTYNAMQWAKRCFESLINSTERVDIFVVDNGSTDGTQDYIKSNYPFVHFEQSLTNDGFGKANNKGLRFALENKYEYVYLLNQDAWIFPDTLSILINVAKEHKDYAIISPMQMQANMKNLDTNFLKFSCGYNSNAHFVSDIFLHNIKDVYDVDFVMAAHWLIPTRKLAEIGIFSPSFPHYNEDNNLIQRAQYFGYKVGIVPQALAVHDREYRVIDDKKKMHLNYTNAILCLSNLQEKYNSLRVIWRVFKMFFTYKSFIAIKYTWLLLSNYSGIIHNKNLSKTTKGAFIY